jgi:hypothetical protein
MPTWKDVVTIAKTLPGVEVTTWYGTEGLKVGGKGFARLRSEAEGGLVLLCTLDEKQDLLDSGDPAYYTTPHYDGFGAIIVNLSKVHKDALRDLMLQSYQMKAAEPAMRAPKASPRKSARRAPRPRR